MSHLNFKGNFDLLEYILSKYKFLAVSPYQLAKQYKYDVSNVHKWRYNKIPQRFWLLLQKDITIAFLMGKIKENISLNDLKDEFENLEPIPTNTKSL